MKGIWRGFLVTGVLLTTGCGQEAESTEHKLVAREATPASAFVAHSYEDTLDAFVTEIERTPPMEMQLGLVLGGSAGYWPAVRAGARRALAELEVAGEVLEDSDPARQAELLRAQRQSGSSAIALAPITAELKGEIDQTVEAGVPVITLQTDVDGSKRALNFGLDHYRVGQTMGDTVTTVIELRLGSVLILGSDDETASPEVYQRTLGAIDTISETGMDVIVVNSDLSAEGEGRDIEALVKALLEAEVRPFGILGVTEDSYRVAMAAEAAEAILDAQLPTPEPGEDAAPAEDTEAEEAGLVHLRSLALLGYGMAPKTRAYLESGILRATHVERWYYMGYLAPYALYGFGALGEQDTMYLLTPHLLGERQLHVGVDAVEDSELEAYDAFLKALGVADR